MIIDINTDFLVRYDLTPNQFLILYSIQYNKMGMLRKIKKSSEDVFNMEYEDLMNKGFIKQVSNKAYVITEKYSDISNGNDLFEELLALFPTSVIRSNGEKDYLKTDKIRCRTKYKRLTRDRRDIHDHVVSCLQYEIQYRERTNAMQYMKKLPNWLASEAWKEWGERMKDENSLSLVDDGAYGTELE